MFIIPPIGKLLRKDVLIMHIIPTLAVFSVLLVFAIISWRSAVVAVETQEDQKINREMGRLGEEVRLRMEMNELLLRAGVGLFDGSDSITRADWDRFYAKLDIQKQFLGVSTLGYAPVVTNANKQAFEDAMRQDGVQDSAIAPAGERELYFPIMYYRTYREGVSPVGLDMYSEPKRRTAIERAVSTGSAAMTEEVAFLSKDPATAPIDGVVMYTAVYDRDAPIETAEQRRAALRGLIYMTLQTDEMFSGITLSDNFSYTIENGGNNFYTADVNTQNKGSETRTVNRESLDIFGQIWQVNLLATGSILVNPDGQRPLTVLMAGIAISVIASIAVYLLVQYRTRSFALSEERKLQQAKDELLSLASHQLRTPATGVKQYVGMVIDGFAGKVSKDQSKLLEQAYKSNERQLQIINEFLYVAKLGSGSLTTTSRNFNIVPLVKDVIEEMELDLKDKGHSLHVTVPKSAVVHADEHSVRMIIENLLSNAIKYTPDNGRIEIKVKSVNYTVRVSVTDNGVGIAKKDMPLLFKQFSRIPNKFSTEISGSGIGLYLSQQLAQRNKGIIKVESEEDKGSTFTLSLPKKL